LTVLISLLGRNMHSIFIYMSVCVFVCVEMVSYIMGGMKDVFENRILRRTFGPNMDENREKRRFHNKELDTLYRSPNIVRVITFRRLRWVEHLVRMEEDRSVFKILTGKRTGKRTLLRPRRRWEGNIRIYLNE
jgi:hypothetical protein